MAATESRSSSMRISGNRARTSSLSIAGLRMSPASPPVQQTSTVLIPSAAYLAMVAAPFDASSSGWACTDRMQSLSSTAMREAYGLLASDRDGPGVAGHLAVDLAG